MKQIWLFGLILPLTSILISCSQGGGGGGSDSNRPQYLGDLDQKAQDIYSQKNEGFFYSCDRTHKDKVLEISRAVEAQRSQIEALMQQGTANPTEYIFTEIGKMSFLEPVHRKTGEDRWYDEREGWALATTWYEQIKNDSTNRKWVNLNSLTRSLILEDQDRIVYGEHPWIRRETEQLVMDTVAALQACFNTADCVSPTLTPEQKSWANKSPYIKNLITGLDLSYPFEKKRKWLGWVLKDILSSSHRYETKKNQDAFVENGALVIPMNLDVFGADANKFSALIERIWNTEGLRISVRNVSTSTSAFKVLVSDSPGERAYVNRAQHIMQLFKPGKVWTVAHEFGHVLGLRDEYFTSFDTDSCEYIYQSNDADLMSTSSTGNVLKSDVEILKKIYGLQ